MASRDLNVDVDEESISSPQDELFFQEIPHTSAGIQAVQTHVFTSFPLQDDSDSDDKTELLEEEKKSQASILSFSYYQAFFDIDSKQVLKRMIGSFLPNPKVNYLHTHIRPKPDLYGPFWVSTTLIVSIAVAGNLLNYFNSYQSGWKFTWKFDFQKVTIATTAIYTYWLLMPLIVYSFLRCRGNPQAYKFSELVCLFGYSLTIYVPVSGLCLIPIVWLQWLFVLIGMALSCVVLIFTIWPALRDDKKQMALILIIIITLMHCILAVGFMLYFFSPTTTSSPIISGNSTSTTIKASTTYLTSTTTKAFQTNLNTTNSQLSS